MATEALPTATKNDSTLISLPYFSRHRNAANGPHPNPPMPAPPHLVPSLRSPPPKQKTHSALQNALPTATQSASATTAMEPHHPQQAKHAASLRSHHPPLHPPHLPIPLPLTLPFSSLPPTLQPRPHCHHAAELPPVPSLLRLHFPRGYAQACCCCHVAARQVRIADSGEKGGLRHSRNALLLSRLGLVQRGGRMPLVSFCWDHGRCRDHDGLLEIGGLRCDLV